MGDAVTTRRPPVRDPRDFEAVITGALDRLDAEATSILAKDAEAAVRALGAAVREGTVSEGIARRMGLATLRDLGLNVPTASADALVTRWLDLPKPSNA
jgi:replication-associated recombination protein RarA